MAHALSIRATGKAEMAYVGKTPWHELGQQLPAGASLEVWAKAAGMDWTIESSPVQFAVNGELHQMPDRVVLYRGDNQFALSSVSRWYKPVPPAEVLGFFRDLTDAAGFTLETAGTLFGGKRLWALASIGAEAAIADQRDKVKGYLLLSTACDGTMATEARYTTVRVVCNNTLGYARNRGKASVKVTHSSTFDPAAVKRELGIETAQAQFTDAMEQFRQMAETRLTEGETIDATANLFVPAYAEMDKAERAKLLGKTSGPIFRVDELAVGRQAIGSDLTGTAGTVWGWLNAVTQYVDHEARAQSQDTRLNSAWYGKGAEIKNRALETATRYVSGLERTRAKDEALGIAPKGASVLDSILARAAA
jgi:phage/plasmid-like protein (TIGR03299 family)